jgi:hypothetical protein
MGAENHEDPIAVPLKLDFLMRHPVPRRILRHDPTMVSFANSLGVARKTLIDQRDKRRLSSYVQGLLAEKLKFRLDWPQWLTGTAEEFRNRYVEEHKAEDEIAACALPPRRHDPSIQLKVQRLVRDTSEGAPDDDRPNLASLTLFLRQVGPGEAIPISVELICQPEPVGSFEVAVYRGRLEIVSGAAPIAHEPAPLASDAAHTLSRNERTLTLERANAGSNDGRIAWTVRSDKGPIGVLRLDDDVDLCRIAEPVGGDTIAAVFHAFVKDLDLAETDPDDEADDRAGPYSFLRPDGKPLSPNKRQLVKRFILKEELGPAPKGWYTLAEDRAKLVRDGK